MADFEGQHPRDDHGKFTNGGGAVHTSKVSRAAHRATKAANASAPSGEGSSKDHAANAVAHGAAAVAHRAAADAHAKAAAGAHDPETRSGHQASENRHRENANEHDRLAANAKENGKLAKSKEAGAGLWASHKLGDVGEHVKEGLESLKEKIKGIGEKGKEAAGELAEGNPLSLGRAVLKGVAFGAIALPGKILPGGRKKKEGGSGEHHNNGEPKKEDKHRPPSEKEREGQFQKREKDLEQQELSPDDDVEA